MMPEDIPMDIFMTGSKSELWSDPERFRSHPGGFLMEGIQPMNFGPEWDRVVNLITEQNYRPKAALIIGPTKLHRIMVAASDEDRLAIQAMQDSGAIIVSHHLPDPEVAYRFEPRDPPESPVPYPIGWEDRMTDRIRRAAGGLGS